MKIDIHAHTQQCKTGDAPTRSISPASFCETILSTHVGIVAITNHNCFDYSQYKMITDRLNNEAQVWPGIELDVLENGSRSHLLVIVSPSMARDFSVKVDVLTKGSSLDSFTTTIDRILGEFDSFKPLYVAHYKQKKPSVSDAALDKLVKGTKNPSRVIKEVTNSISAGIYISHGHASLFGSDVQDWGIYKEISQDLPDLRLPVNSFDQFCLLLEKDPTTINTVLDRKTPEDLTLDPFDDGSTLKIKVFDDINVIFGPKGTGKSCILRAIAKHYAESGIDAKVYESASDRLDEIFDTKGKDLTINLNDYSINYCTSEIGELRSASEANVTSLSKFLSYCSAKNTNRNARMILLKDIEPEEESGAERDFSDFDQAVKTTKDFLEYLAMNPSVKKELTAAEHSQVTNILSDLLARLSNRKWTSFSAWKEICLLNLTIRTIRKEVERKTGSPAKPTTTGFRDYALNRIKICANAAEVVRTVGMQIPAQRLTLGSLGSNKGELEFRTECGFQSGDVTDSSLSSLTGVKKGPQKKFMNCIRRILKQAYCDDLFQHISELNKIEDAEGIRTVYELLLFRRYFALDGIRYTPSSGEASMVMLQKELETDKEVYILDEPERSLGNEYISDVIVPLIKERARTGKKMFISTHDANIAVRTLPYSSVYRCHEKSGYATYVGNPFSGCLINLENDDDRLDWKKVSMRTLEGGEEAFGERGKIYGND